MDAVSGTHRALWRSKCVSESERDGSPEGFLHFLCRRPAIFALFVKQQEVLGVRPSVADQLIEAVWTLPSWVLLGTASNSDPNPHPLPPVHQSDWDLQSPLGNTFVDGRLAG